MSLRITVIGQFTCRSHSAKDKLQHQFLYFSNFLCAMLLKCPRNLLVIQQITSYNLILIKTSHSLTVANNIGLYGQPDMSRVSRDHLKSARKKRCYENIRYLQSYSLQCHQNHLTHQQSTGYTATVIFTKMNFCIRVKLLNISTASRPGTHSRLSSQTRPILIKMKL